tara:strand:+ start:209 stop:544 length:336 start_codon:yes stop_codon:yes gene_type:complete
VDGIANIDPTALPSIKPIPANPGIINKKKNPAAPEVSEKITCNPIKNPINPPIIPPPATKGPDKTKDLMNRFLFASLWPQDEQNLSSTLRKDLQLGQRIFLSDGYFITTSP